MVRVGPFPNLESAASAIQQLRRVDLRPGVEGSGKEFFVVVQRNASRPEAEEIRARAARAGVRCTIVAQ
jgi:hypothetical protein